MKVFILELKPTILWNHFGRGISLNEIINETFTLWILNCNNTEIENVKTWCVYVTFEIIST